MAIEVQPENLAVTAVADLKTPTQLAQLGGLAITLQLTNPEEVDKMLGFGEAFQKGAEKEFVDFVHEVHKYLIRITPIDTGELRGGWTAFLDKDNIDYARQIFDTSLAVKASGRDYHITPEGVQEGKGFSQYEAPTPFEVTLINSVPHGFYLDQGTSKMAARNFVALALYKAEFWYEKSFKEWFDLMSASDKVVEPPPVQEIQV